MNRQPGLNPPVPPVEFWTEEARLDSRARAAMQEDQQRRVPWLLQTAAIVFTQSPNVTFAVNAAFEMEAAIQERFSFDRQHFRSTQT